jgi:hypothetical protein
MRYASQKLSKLLYLIELFMYLKTSAARLIYLPIGRIFAENANPLPLVTRTAVAQPKTGISSSCFAGKHWLIILEFF